MEDLKNSRLTPMHWELFRLIESRTKGRPEESVSQREIYEHLLSKGYDVAWNESQNQHNDHCRWLWTLIDGEGGINHSPEVDSIIVHDREYNYRLGTEGEVLAKWWHYFEKARKARERHLALLTKIKLDGQGKLLSNQLREIDEDSLAKLYHETFNKKGTEDEHTAE